MELKKFRESKLATPIAVVATVLGAVGVAGCGPVNEETVDNFNRGNFTEGKYYFPKSSGDERLEISCKGNDTFVLKANNNAVDNTFTYLNEPACKDGVITPEDNLAPVISESYRR